MFDDTEEWCKIWRKTDLCFLKSFVYRLQNSDFILETKMTELNWKQNLLIYFPILMDMNRLMNTFLIVFPDRHSKDRNLNILLMVSSNPIKEIV